MQHIPKDSLSRSLPSRLAYVHSFLGFGASDGSAIQASAPLLGPLIPGLLDGIYTKLLTYDITASAFLPKIGHELEEASAPQSPEELTLQHPYIKRQMSFLRAYILRVAGNTDWSPESKLWEYMDHVAIMHTGSPGFKHGQHRPELRVEYEHIALLLGYLEDMIVDAVMGMAEVEFETRVAVFRAWNKVLWVQNDLFARHYVKGVEEVREGKEKVGAAGVWDGMVRDVVIGTLGGVLMVGLFTLLR